MACRFLESFDYYTTDGQMLRKWTSTTSSINIAIQSSVVRTGARALIMTSTTDLQLALDSQASWVVGFGFQVSRINAANTILEFQDNGTVQVSLRLNANGTLEVLQGTTTTVTDGRSIVTLKSGAWYFIEMKVTIADSIGADTCVVRVNEEVILTVATSQDLKVSANATADIIRFRASIIVVNHYFDDIYIFDGTGSDNNDFVGDVTVDMVLPDGNGTTNDFTRSAGANNFELVDETDTDDDSTYNESSTATDIDLYTYGALVTSDTVYAVQINMVVKKDDAGSRTVRSMARPVSTNFEGDNVHSPSDGSYLNFIEVYDLNPQTSLAWTETLFNATEFGIKIET